MDKLLQKEGKVAKVPDFNYGGREREREKEVEGGNQREWKENENQKGVNCELRGITL